MLALECGGWSGRKNRQFVVTLVKCRGKRNSNGENLTTSISVLEWPMLHTMQLFFIRSKCSRVTTFLFPKVKKNGWRKRCWHDSTSYFQLKPGRHLLPSKSLHALWEKCVQQKLECNYLDLRPSNMKNHQGKKLFLLENVKSSENLLWDFTHWAQVLPSVSLLRFSLRVNIALSTYTKALLLTCASYYNIHLPDDLI